MRRFSRALFFNISIKIPVTLFCLALATAFTPNSNTNIRKPKKCAKQLFIFDERNFLEVLLVEMQWLS